MLHSRLLRYLDEVVRSGSIRRAAEKLNVASSSINRQIIELEAELGTPLFERLPRRLRLTAAGEILINHIRQTLRDHDRARFRIAELGGVGRGTIRIGTMNGLASGLLPHLCRNFVRSFPGVRFEVKSLLAPEIVSAVADGEVSFGLGYNLAPSPSLRVVETFRAQLGVVAAPGHKLADRAQLRLSDLAGEMLVHADSMLTIRAIVDEACRKVGVDLPAPFETNSVQMMKHLVVEGRAVTFLSPPDIDSEVESGSLVYIPLRDRLTPNPLLLVERPGGSENPSAALFMDRLQLKLRQIIPGPRDPAGLSSPA
ncbi:LysR family transcriptional regulator [Devosia chinhatensis]|uniref:LysR family transcriptional regulator n=1 Tax=Devosia chinhatensis TaxID=429727 RepID=UPI000B1D7D02|nr:LysR family transcriptional regulator [Devosia chinhatensis]